MRRTPKNTTATRTLEKTSGSYPHVEPSAKKQNYYMAREFSAIEGNKGEIDLV